MSAGLVTSLCASLDGAKQNNHELPEADITKYTRYLITCIQLQNKEEVLKSTIVYKSAERLLLVP